MHTFANSLCLECFIDALSDVGGCQPDVNVRSAGTFVVRYKTMHARSVAISSDNIYVQQQRSTRADI